MPTVVYGLEPGLAPEELIDVLVRSTLAERRPVHDPGTIRAMLAYADVIVTARLGGLLVGVWRAISDFAYCTYLSDLAVDEGRQRQGIERRLIRRTHEAAGLHTTLVLVAAPKARAYYPRVGMRRHDYPASTPARASPSPTSSWAWYCGPALENGVGLWIKPQPQPTADHIRVVD